MDREEIQIRAKSESFVPVRLLSLLERVLPVKFTIQLESGGGSDNRWLVFSTPKWSSYRKQNTVSTLTLPGHKEGLAFARTARVRFLDAAPRPFTERVVWSKFETDPTLQKPVRSEEVLAETDDGAVWYVTRSGGGQHFSSALYLPEVSGTADLQDILSGEYFFGVLPLLHLLREKENDEYDMPPLRACFVFDDPNLHWPRYGFVDYRTLACDAAKENYHVSFATIPLDAWFTHKPTARLFSESRRLSLAVHGNNHTKHELARRYTREKRTRLLTQALYRISRIEDRTGASVDRIMIPPHGACSESMLVDLPRCGFEAACISHGSLRAHNRGEAWVEAIGYHPCEAIGPCSVMPRWPFSKDPLNTILIAAFLHQPLIFRGHQSDLRDGIEVLHEHARIINTLGPVTWGSLLTLSRMNFARKVERDTLGLRLWARRVSLKVPRGILRLDLKSPFFDDRRLELNPLSSLGSGFAGQVLQQSGIQILTHPDGQIDFWPDDCADETHSGGILPPPWAVLRRVLAETRDRLALS